MHQDHHERGTAQLNVKIAGNTRSAFAKACEARRESQREVIERLLESYVAAFENRAVLHLDGSLCPLTQLIRDLVSSAREQHNAGLHPYRPEPQQTTTGSASTLSQEHNR